MWTVSSTRCCCVSCRPQRQMFQRAPSCCLHILNILVNTNARTCLNHRGKPIQTFFCPSTEALRAVVPTMPVVSDKVWPLRFVNTSPSQRRTAHYCRQYAHAHTPKHIPESQVWFMNPNLFSRVWISAYCQHIVSCQKHNRWRGVYKYQP